MLIFFRDRFNGFQTARGSLGASSSIAGDINESLSVWFRFENMSCLSSSGGRELQRNGSLGVGP